MTKLESQEVVVTRLVNAPVAEVWQFWSQPDKIKQWWGPDHFEGAATRVDFREGGVALVSMASPTLGFPEQFSTWLYTRIVPHERIEYIHNLADSQGNRVDPVSMGLPADFPQDLKTVVLFVAEGNKTRLTVMEFLPVTSMLENAKIGLNQSIDKLVRAAALGNV
jgi:uncharacterized protein YndB with AHSA1/START domain